MKPAMDEGTTTKGLAGIAATLDKRLPEPLYYQLFRSLRDRILKGEFSPDAAFPSEAELTNGLNVSRATVRRALEELASRGLIRREQGRASRIVPYRPAANLRASVTGLVENSRRMAEKTSVELLEFEYLPAEESVAIALQVARGTPVQRAVRVRSFQGVPFSYAITHLPEDIGRTFQREELSSIALLDLLERSGVEVARAEQTISASEATPVIAAALRIEVGKALLHTTRVVFDQQGRAVEFIDVLYRPDIYQYVVSLKRMRGQEGRSWSARAMS